VLFRRAFGHTALHREGFFAVRREISSQHNFAKDVCGFRVWARVCVVLEVNEEGNWWLEQGDEMLVLWFDSGRILY